MDPFMKLLEQFHTPESGLAFSQGKVTSTAPLTVFCSGLSFTKSELRVNAELLREPEEGEEPPLEAGNSVLCCTLDEWQTLYILCKVVTP